MGRSGIGRGRREVMESYRDFRIEACKKSIVDGLVHWGKQNCPCKEVNQILLLNTFFTLNSKLAIGKQSRLYGHA